MTTLASSNAQHPGAQDNVHYLQDSEKTLIALFRQKDPHAFRQLYDRYPRRVFALCLRLTGNVALAEEAPQEVFIQVWRMIDSFSGNSSL